MTDEVKTAFEDAALARDEAGYLGTPAQCIRALDEENRRLRRALVEWGGERAVNDALRDTRGAE